MTISILLVGCGNWGKNILRDLKLLGCQVMVLGYSEIDVQNAKAFGADYIVETINQVSLVHGIVVASPASTHAQVIYSLSHLQVPVFVEKPMVTHLNDAEKLSALLGDRLFVMHKWCYHPGVNLLREIITSQEFGRLKALKTKRLINYTPHSDVDMVWTLMPHELSIARHLLGYLPQPTQVVATQWGSEAVSMFAVFANDPWVVSEISSIAPIRNISVSVELETATLLLNDGYSDCIEIYSAKHKNSQAGQWLENCEKRLFQGSMPLYLELEEFVNYLKGGPKPRCDAKQGLDIIATIDQMRRMANLTHSGVYETTN